MLRSDVLVKWTTPRREMLDPTKETDGLVKQVQAGLKSYAEAVRELGYEWADTLDEVAEVQKVLDEKETSHFSRLPYPNEAADYYQSISTA